MKRIFLPFLVLLFLFSSCGISGTTTETESPGSEQSTAALERFEASFLDVFDTVTNIVGYAESEEAFTEAVQNIHDELEEYHQLYDIYNEYEGVTNLKTVNDNAGGEPVEVDQRIIDLLVFSREMYEATGGMTNVAMGAVLSIWHDARETAINDPSRAYVPELSELEAASEHTDFDSIVIDEANRTVQITDPEASLDVGAIAKGYAVEMVARNAAPNLLLSVGGNVRPTGPKPEEDSRWVVGVESPEDTSSFLHTLYIEDLCVVTSGDYQRYYYYDGVRYSHIIDPNTLFPPNYWRSVTILCPDSGIADALSTALFCMTQEDGQALLDKFDAEAMWVTTDGEMSYSPGFEQYIRT